MTTMREKKTIGEKINFMKKKKPKLIPVEEHIQFEDKRRTELQRAGTTERRRRCVIPVRR